MKAECSRAEGLVVLAEELTATLKEICKENISELTPELKEIYRNEFGLTFEEDE